MHRCDECKQTIPRGEAVIRGCVHGQTAWHLACWVIRCLRAELDETAQIGGTLTERLERVRA